LVIVGQGIAGWYEEVAHDETRADILMRGSNDFEALTPFKQHQFDLLMRSLIIEVEGLWTLWVDIFCSVPDRVQQRHEQVCAERQDGQ
jgi:hypothetical protein